MAIWDILQMGYLKKGMLETIQCGLSFESFEHPHTSPKLKYALACLKAWRGMLALVVGGYVMARLGNLFIPRSFGIGWSDSIRGRHHSLQINNKTTINHVIRDDTCLYTCTISTQLPDTIASNQVTLLSEDFLESHSWHYNLLAEQRESAGLWHGWWPHKKNIASPQEGKNHPSWHSRSWVARAWSWSKSARPPFNLADHGAQLDMLVPSWKGWYVSGFNLFWHRLGIFSCLEICFKR